MVSSCGNRLFRTGEFLGQLNKLATAIRQTNLHNAPYNFPYIRMFTAGLSANAEAFRGEVALGTFSHNVLLPTNRLPPRIPAQMTLGMSCFQTDVTELCPSPALLAQQLTHVELERLSYIGPEEFVQAFAKENPHLETSFKDMKKTRNLESYVQWFNRLSYFVATEVCKVNDSFVVH